MRGRQQLYHVVHQKLVKYTWKEEVLENTNSEQKNDNNTNDISEVDKENKTMNIDVIGDREDPSEITKKTLTTHQNIKEKIPPATSIFAIILLCGQEK